MTCYRPQPAALYRKPLSEGGGFYQPQIIYPVSVDANGARNFSYSTHRYLDLPFDSHTNLPCGVCFGCRIDNARNWSLRMMHEARYSTSSFFVTLTYDPDHLPLYGDLNYYHLSKFWKDSRHIFQEKGRSFRYFACGEYGDKTLRPHYHFAGFDWKIDDLKFFKKTATGNYFLSDRLRSVWGRGHVIVAPLEYQSAAYIARYVTKKMHGGNVRYLPDESADPETGEIFPYTIQRSFQSKGLGLKWYNDHFDEVWNLDGCLYNNSYMILPPRYYFKQLEKSDPDRAARIKENRNSDHPYMMIDTKRDSELLYQMEARRLQMSVLKRELI